MKSYKELITSINEKTIKIGSFGRTIKVEKPLRAKKDKMVDLNVAAFDKAFKRESDFYIGRNGKGEIKGRYKRFEIFVKGGVDNIGDGIKIKYEPADMIEVSEVCVNSEGEVSFINGRHRYAWLRDQGLKKIPVTMDSESIKNAKKFNYI